MFKIRSYRPAAPVHPKINKNVPFQQKIFNPIIKKQKIPPHEQKITNPTIKKSNAPYSRNFSTRSNLGGPNSPEPNVFNDYFTKLHGRNFNKNLVENNRTEILRSAAFKFFTTESTSKIANIDAEINGYANMVGNMANYYWSNEFKNRLNGLYGQSQIYQYTNGNSREFIPENVEYLFTELFEGVGENIPECVIRRTNNFDKFDNRVAEIFKNLDVLNENKLGDISQKDIDETIGDYSKLLGNMGEGYYADKVKNIINTGYAENVSMRSFGCTNIFYYLVGILCILGISYAMACSLIVFAIYLFAIYL